MKRAMRRLGLTLLLLAGCATAGYAPYPPPRKGAPKLWVPAFTTTHLPNGIELSVNPDNYLPMAAIAVGVRGGFLLDPPAKAGLSRLLAEMMTARAQQLPRVKLMVQYDNVGDGVHTDVGPDGIIFHIDVLEDRTGPALAMLAHLLQHPDFDADELERLRNIERAVLEHRAADPESAALQGLRQVVFGREHPVATYGAGTAKSLASLTVDDLRARYEQIVRPDNIVIGVAGRVETDRVAQVVTQVFGGWQKAAGATAVPMVGPGPEPSERKKIYYLPRPALSQTVICVGSRGLPEPDPHYQLLRMIGGRVPASAGAWLRGVEQVTYGVRYLDEATSRTGLYGTLLAVDARRTGDTVKAILDRYDAMPGGNFDIEKVVVLTEEGSPFLTIAGRARHVASLFVRGLSLDYFGKLRERLDNDRGNDLEAMVLEYLKSSRMQVVLVGDPEVIRSQVGPLGEGELEELRLATD
jgi:zinc protease